jgi:hypothetical protein
LAADFFRANKLEFNDQYIDVHNAISAIQQGHNSVDSVPDISRSKVDPGYAARARKHPFLAALDEEARILTEVQVHLRRTADIGAQGEVLGGSGGEGGREGHEGREALGASEGREALDASPVTFRIRVYEGEFPEQAVARWEREVVMRGHRGDGGMGPGGRGGGRELTSIERANVLDQVSEEVVEILMREDAVAYAQRGWAAGGGVLGGGGRGGGEGGGGTHSGDGSRGVDGSRRVTASERPEDRPKFSKVLYAVRFTK